MNGKFVKFLLVFPILLVVSGNCFAEIMVAKSVEWLSVSSDVVAVGRISSVTKVAGEGSVVYENFTLNISYGLKGLGRRRKLEFTVRTFSTEPVFGSKISDIDEVIVFLTQYRDAEKFLKGKFVPTSTSFPLSVMNTYRPGRLVIDLNFNVLATGNEVLEISRKTQSQLESYRQLNPHAEIKGYYVEIPDGTEAFGNLFAGSACFLQVPNFMSTDSKESILQIFRTR